jgi:exodeoxyribonuclease VII small subunit
MTESVQNSDFENEKFSTLLAQLEQLVTRLESGSLELEESLDSYNQGIALIAALQKKLSDAEQKVTEMTGGVVQQAQASSGGHDEQAAF